MVHIGNVRPVKDGIGDEGNKAAVPAGVVSVPGDMGRDREPETKKLRY